MSPGVLASVAFALALVLSLLLTPVSRALAVRFGVLDHPDQARSYKRHASPVPYLGGYAVLVAVFVISASAGAWRQAVVVGLSTFLLFTVGLLDDVRGLGLWSRILVQVAVAAVTATVGEVVVSVTGVEFLDRSITVVWLIGMTNAVNILDNANGIAAGTAAIAGVAFAILAVLEGQYLVATIAASVGGGALGFLPYNFPTARQFMGDAGTLPLGYLLGLVAVKVDVGIAHPWNFILPVAVLALPVVNTLVVVAHRLRLRQPFYVGGVDSIWHRLLAIGFPRTRAVLLLFAGSSVIGAISVFSAQGSLPVYAPALGLGVALAAGASALRIDVDEQGSHESSEEGVAGESPEQTPAAAGVASPSDPGG